MVLAPSDHVIRDEAAFLAALERAAGAAAAGRLVCLGIAPDRPETGYGYLELAEVSEEAGQGSAQGARR